MKKLKSIMAGTIAVTMLASTAAFSQSYEPVHITNGNFEEGLKGWSQTWQKGTGALEVISEKGNKVLHLQSDTGSCYVSQNIANIAEGDRINLSFRMKIDSLNENNGCADITIGYKDKKGQYITQGYNVYYEDTNGKWVYKSIDLIVPPGVGSMSLLMRLYDGGDLYYDDIDITDFDNKTGITVTKGEMELNTIPKGVGEISANLHYVPEEIGEQGNLIFAAYENKPSGEKELIGIKIKPFRAARSLYTQASLNIPDDAENVTVSAYVWKNGQLSQPICQTLDLPKKGRSEVFDTFAVDRMRGAYDAVVCFYDEERMNRLEEYGINTFIFNIIGDFHGGDINKNTEALDAVCADMEKYVEETGNRIFLKASYGSESVIRNVTYGAFHPGTENNLSLPCPLQEQYWEDEMMSRLEVVARHPKIIGAIFDMEMYSGGRTSYGGPCMCNNCVEKFADKKGSKLANGLVDELPESRVLYLRKNRMSDEYKEWFADSVAELASKMRERLHAINPDLIIGMMPTMEWLLGLPKGLGTEEMPLMVFEENTYRGVLDIINTSEARAELNGYSVIFATGLWPNEEYNAIKKQDFASKIVAAEPKGVGYWIYSVTEMDKEPAYYDGLKKGNDKLLGIEETSK